MTWQRANIGEQITLTATKQRLTVVDYAPDDDGTPAYYVEGLPKRRGQEPIILSCFLDAPYGPGHKLNNA